VILESLVGLFEQYPPMSWAIAGFSAFIFCSLVVLILGTWRLRSAIARQQMGHAEAALEEFNVAKNAERDEVSDRVLSAVMDKYPHGAIFIGVVEDGGAFWQSTITDIDMVKVVVDGMRESIEDGTVYH